MIQGEQANERPAFAKVGRGSAYKQLPVCAERRKQAAFSLRTEVEQNERFYIPDAAVCGDRRDAELQHIFKGDGNRGGQMALHSGAHGLFRRLRYHSEAVRWLYKLVVLMASQAVADLRITASQAVTGCRGFTCHLWVRFEG